MSRLISSEDRRELGRLTKVLSQKIVQVVVQSRLGEKAYTRSKSPEQGSDWFNLGIEDVGEIQNQVKKSLGGHLPEKGKPLVVEILLKTPAADSLVLEFWTLTVLDACDTSPARINPTIYNRMTVLLKSLLSVTRITPAYKLAFRQGPESFIICYRVYLGNPDYKSLGENSVQSQLGQVATPESTLLLCVTYRTQITLAAPTHSTAHDAMMVKSDHFKTEISPRHCRRVSERGNDSSEATQTSDESQDAGRFFTTSPPDHPSTPRSRTSSESSCRGHTQQTERKVSVAFVDQKQPKPDDFILTDIPFSNLLASTIEPKGEKDITAPQTQDKAGGGVGRVEGGEKIAMTGSDGSHKSTASSQLKEESGFVVVELKTPFATVQDAGNDLGMFYRECQNAPQLRMFTDTPEDEISDLAEQLQAFEGFADEYNELVRSLHSEESLSSSQ